MIIFLQNAWSPVYAGTVWPRRSWLRALARSRSGGKLKMLTDDLSVVHNVAPICGAKPSSVTPVDQKHVEAILASCEPRVVVACGIHAETALRLWWRGPLLCIPHPAARVVTNGLYEAARRWLDCWEQGALPPRHRIALRQLRGRLKWEPVS